VEIRHTPEFGRLFSFALASPFSVITFVRA
jgi:hypothetical protein